MSALNWNRFLAVQRRGFNTLNSVTEILYPEILDPEILYPEILDPEILCPEILDPEIVYPEIFLVLED